MSEHFDSEHFDSEICSLEQDILKNDTSIVSLQKEITELKKLLSPNGSWSTMIKNGNLRDRITRSEHLLNEHNYQKEILNAKLVSLKEHKEKTLMKKERSRHAIQCLRNAGFVIYESKKYNWAVTAQQVLAELISIKKNISSGCIVHMPDEILRGAIEFFKKEGFANVNDAAKLGNIELVPEEYRHAIATTNHVYKINAYC